MDLFDEIEDEADEPFEDDGSEIRPMRDYVEQAYRNYSIYVIHDRALPHVGDGLKPVQRRIVYAMSQLGLGPRSKHKKSARAVGDVIGKYHPHGDQACYDAMVLLSQSFSTRYPLVDGQGNWGTQDDPKSYAAMRYTEARLTHTSHAVLLGELNQGTVEPFVQNFDGTLREPLVLPARLPLLLCNGVTGIAVGMATDIPPHNAQEVVDATIALIDRKSTSIEELCELLPGPDFPSEAMIITPRAELAEIYRTGNGSVRARAVWDVEEGDIVISALPFHVSGSKVEQQIAEQMRAKKLPMVTNVCDESDYRCDTRLVISHKRGTDRQALMGHLFATTDLERTYRVNINVLGLANDEHGNQTIFPGAPRVFDLRELLLEWITFRRIATLKRLRVRLQRVERELRKLAAWLIAHLNIDRVIEIIRTHDEPKPVLMEEFSLTDEQAEWILELKLRNLRKLEELKIREQQKALEEERDTLRKTIDSPARLKTLMKKELREAVKEIADERRSPIVEGAPAACAMDETALITSEPITVVLSEQGWVKAGKGHDLDVETLTYKGNDCYLDHALGRSTWQSAFLDSTGRAYSLASHTLKSARGAGEPLTGHFSTPPGAMFVACLCGEPTDLYLMASDAGYGFVCELGDLFGRNKAGKRTLSLPANAAPLIPARVADPEGARVVAVSSVGRLLAFPIAELPRMSRGKGNKLIAIKPALLARGEERMVGAIAMGESDKLLVHSGKRYTRLRYADLEPFIGMRGRRGDLLPKGFRKVDRIEIEDVASSAAASNGD